MSYVIKKDYYKILGVSQNATEEEIKSAYRKVAKEFHPDLHANNPLAKLAEEKFKEINEAYEILGDSEKRKLYDGVKVDSQNNFHNTTPNSNEQQTNNSKREKNQSREEKQYNNREQPQREHNSQSEQTENKKSGKFYTACHIHINIPAVAKCSVCGMPLCEDCASTFDVLMCPACLNNNNDIYIKSLKSPLYLALFSIIGGMAAGVAGGIRYNIFRDYGILEGLIFGIYLTSFSLYLQYISQKLQKTLIKILEVILYVFDVNADAISFAANVLNLIIGLTFGWIFGLFWGSNKLRKDCIEYTNYKPEYIKTKNFIKEKFGI